MSPKTEPVTITREEYEDLLDKVAKHEALMAAKEAVRFIHNWDMDRLGMIAATKISTAYAALRAAGLGLEEKHD